MKVTWVEASTLKVGDVVVLRRQELQLTELKTKGDSLTLYGKTEDGRKVVCVVVVDELVQKVLE